MNNLGFIRKTKGYTLKELSDKTSISVNQITYLEKINIDFLTEYKEQILNQIINYLKIEKEDIKKGKEDIFYKFYETKEYKEGLFKCTTILDKYKILAYKKKHNLKGKIKPTNLYLIKNHKIYNVKNKKYVQNKWEEIEL